MKQLAPLTWIQPTQASWLQSPGHLAWLEAERARLLDFYQASRIETGGFGALDDHGRLAAEPAPDTLITTRMIHCYALAAMRGRPGTEALAAHGIAALNGVLYDAEHGGWYAGAPQAGFDDDKKAYMQVFVALAAATAYQAGVADSRALLNRALEVIETRFWIASEGALCDSYSRDWQHCEAYRGGNSNMHAVELFLELSDVLDEAKWRHRALAIAERLIHRHAAACGYLVVEHFDENWEQWREYNADQPADAFRPYGLTPGHAFEWSRLLLHLEAALLRHDEHAPAWLFEAAAGLFAAGCEYGWAADGAPGIVYTLDWQRRPRVHARLHWTIAEAAAAAAALLRRTGAPGYERWYRTFWDYIDLHMIDRERGSWIQELDEHNQPAASTWSGKPDLYHAYQATLLPRLPLAPTLAAAIAAL